MQLDRIRAHRSQYVHLNGLCPLCVRLCIVSAPVIANALPQPGKSQTYGSDAREKVRHRQEEVGGAIRTFLGVPTHVLSERGCLGEILIADVALERSVSCMTLIERIAKVRLRIMPGRTKINSEENQNKPVSASRSSACLQSHSTRCACSPPKSIHSAPCPHRRASRRYASSAHRTTRMSPRTRPTYRRAPTSRSHVQG